MNIRKAEAKDADRLIDLLKQVLKVHADMRPDIFVYETTKYEKEEVLEMIADKSQYIYVAVDDSDYVLGYAFCSIKTHPPLKHLQHFDIFFIDDFCVDEKYRHQGIGKALFEYIIQVAKKLDCYEVALCAWEGNDIAMKFYEKMGLKTKTRTMEFILKE